MHVVLEHLPILHHELHIPELFDVPQRVTGNGNDVRIGANRDHADLPAAVEHLSCPCRGAPNGIHGTHAEIDHTWKFLCNRLGPRNSADVGPKDNLYTRLYRFFKALFMNGGAQSIALSGRSSGRSPVGVIDSNRRAVPRPLFNHLGNLRIAEHKAVFDGIASAIEGALQTDPGIGVASDFLSPAVRFINDGLQFFQSQGWLRNQLSVFAYP